MYVKSIVIVKLSQPGKHTFPESLLILDIPILLIKALSRKCNLLNETSPYAKEML